MDDIDERIEYEIIVRLDGEEIYTETRTSGDSACEAIGRGERYAQRMINEEEGLEDDE